MPYPKSMPTLTPCNVPVRRCPVPRNDAPRRFLIVQLWALGDVLMATPLAAALRRAYPDCHITWLIHPDTSQAIDANPDVDEVIIWDTDFWKNLLPDRWKRVLRPKRFLGIPWLIQALRARRDLRRLRTDVLISMHPDVWPTLVLAAKPNMAIGLFQSAPQKDRRRRYDRFYTVAYGQADLARHRTDTYLLPLRALGVRPPEDKRMSLGYTAADEESVATLLGENGIRQTDPLAVLAPMTTWASKCWPTDRYALLGDALATRHGHKIVLIGMERERAAVERVARRMKNEPLVIAGSLKFRQIAALLSRAALVISGDTAPMHAAAALGIPYVGLFGPTDGAHLAPLSGHGITLSHLVPCGPCGHTVCPRADDGHMQCMHLISVEEVVTAAGRVLCGLPCLPRDAP